MEASDIFDFDQMKPSVKLYNFQRRRCCSVDVIQQMIDFDIAGKYICENDVRGHLMKMSNVLL